MLKRSSPSLISLVTFVFILSVTLSDRSAVVSGSVISASTASSTDFELQTNLITCGTQETTPAAPPSEDSGANSTPATVTTMDVAVCSPPESKLFGNVKIVNGTPHPGPTGVRGRLYDVGTLCDAKIADKIDRAWVAFLDCAGCSLTTKLANLESSNPQAILIYNQTSCVFPTPQAPAPIPPATSSAPIPPATSSIASAPAAPVETEPVEQTPAPPPPPKDGDDKSGGDDGESNGGSKGGSDSGGDNGDNGGDGGGNGDDDADGADSAKHVQSVYRRAFEPQEMEGYIHSPRPRPRLHPISESEVPEDPPTGDDDPGYVHSPRPRPHPHPVVGRRDLFKSPADVVTTDRAAEAGASTTADLSQATIKFGTTVAMVEAMTVDYLFKVLLGPASYAPIPTALRSLKTIAHQNDPSTNPSLGAKSTSSANSITDLMVSISPSNSGESSSSDPKFLSMSKPIFGTVIGVVAVVVCAVVLVWVVRPLYQRHQQKNEDRIEELEQSNDHSGNDGGGYYETGGVGAIDEEPKLDPEQLYENYQQQQHRHQYQQQALSSDFSEVPVMPTLMSTGGYIAQNDTYTPAETEKLQYQVKNDSNTVPETANVPMSQPQAHTVPMSYATTLPSTYFSDQDISNDDEKLAQQQLQRLPQQQEDPVQAITESEPRRTSLSFERPELGMPAWRKHRDGQRSVSSISVTSTQATSTPVTRVPPSQVEEDQTPFEKDQWEEEPSPVSRVSIDSGRRGGELFNAPSLRRNHFQS